MRRKQIQLTISISLLLPAGDHTRHVQVAAPSTGGLMKFAVRNATCLGCKVPLGKTGNYKMPYLFINSNP